MKKIACLLLVGFSLMPAGCGKSATTPLSNADKIVGAWLIVKIGDKDVPDDKQRTVEFAKDGSGFRRDAGSDEKDEMTWKIEGDKIWIAKKGDSNSEPATIKSLTADSAIIYDDKMSKDVHLKKRK
ncbi:MAG: hypothetical protein K8T89_02435 [Planctomycetes bacterium]|nr:hypothetical protein [Planctomycetota bacterium]